MDKIEFQIGMVIIQLADGLVRIWNGKGEISDVPDVELPIQALKNALYTAQMLRRE